MKSELHYLARTLLLALTLSISNAQAYESALKGGGHRYTVERIKEKEPREIPDRGLDGGQDSKVGREAKDLPAGVDQSRDGEALDSRVGPSGKKSKR